MMGDNSAGWDGKLVEVEEVKISTLVGFTTKRGKNTHIGMATTKFENIGFDFFHEVRPYAMISELRTTPINKWWIKSPEFKDMRKY